jgi:hypothetical protein
MPLLCKIPLARCGRLWGYDRKLIQTSTSSQFRLRSIVVENSSKGVSQRASRQDKIPRYGRTKDLLALGPVKKACLMVNCYPRDLLSYLI